MKPSFVICNDKQEYLHLVQFYDGIVPIVRHIEIRQHVPMPVSG